VASIAGSAGLQGLGFLSALLVGTAILAVVLVRLELRFAGRHFATRFFVRLLSNVALIALSSVFCLTVLEVYVKLSDSNAAQPPGIRSARKAAKAARQASPPDVPSVETGSDLQAEVATAMERMAAASRQAATSSEPRPLTMPEAWAMRPTNIPGAARAYYWHGVLHVFDARGRRSTAPIPQKRVGTFRIAIYGDSLTYGQGVDEAKVYPTLLEESLGEEFRVEVLNLGIMGYQADDVLNDMRREIPETAPDLVVYGVCLNDYLPSGVGQYDDTKAYAFPLPSSVKNLLIKRSLAASYLSGLYDQFLLDHHIRKEFMRDIVANFDDLQGRFAADVGEMNRLAMDATGRPLVAMVLDQFPLVGSDGWRIAVRTEEILTAAGVQVVPSAAYYRAFSGHGMGVSAWEGHPNAEAHAIFAAAMRPALARQIPPVYRLR
jgi:hypothetical protein